MRLNNGTHWWVESSKYEGKKNTEYRMIAWSGGWFAHTVVSIERMTPDIAKALVSDFISRANQRWDEKKQSGDFGFSVLRVEARN